MNHFPPVVRTPFGPWVDPRNPRPGGPTSPIPDIEWPNDPDALVDAVDRAGRHALLDYFQWDLGVAHFVWNGVWLRTTVNFEAGMVSVETSLLDLVAPSDRSRGSEFLAGLRAGSPHIWFDMDGHGLVMRTTLSAYPFVPSHLGQVLLDFVELGETILSAEQWDPDVFQVVTLRAYELVLPPFCGTSMVNLQVNYASIAGHPLHDRPYEGEVDFDWDE